MLALYIFVSTDKGLSICEYSYYISLIDHLHIKKRTPDTKIRLT